MYDLFFLHNMYSRKRVSYIGVRRPAIDFGVHKWYKTTYYFKEWVLAVFAHNHFIDPLKNENAVDDENNNNEEYLKERYWVFFTEYESAEKSYKASNHC